ncbi:hypothetical protein SanaruYs_19200 [Chryseotalea sanaruensis]|uniref:Uncharacterized protein n=1 Tax=Chryseotalea sanaruensis TaxID=2482724 RepID=A0A401U9Z4_9BACT|nr:hypothetical protein [Chryseotalea sanaruensis]GCC51692.1 hypothetical protein SanaruYs_19200 [Chryseotalea sanaruensis]
MIDIGLYITYFLFAVAVAAAVGMPLVNAGKSPGSMKKSLIAVGALVVLFAVSYGLSGSGVTPEQAVKGITESSSKLIGAGLTMLYLCMGISVVAIIYSEISKAIK